MKSKRLHFDSCLNCRDLPVDDFFAVAFIFAKLRHNPLSWRSSYRKSSRGSEVSRTRSQYQVFRRDICREQHFVVGAIVLKDLPILRAWPCQDAGRS